MPKDNAPKFKLKSPAIFDVYWAEYDNTDWKALKEANPLALVIQASHGNSPFYTETSHKEIQLFVDKARENGIKYGLYHFLTPNDIDKQAKNYVAKVKSLGGLGDMEPIVDVEIDFSPRIPPIRIR